MPEVQPACLARPETPDEVTAAIVGLRGDSQRLWSLIQALPIAVYMTDAQGWVTCFNQACVDLAGRHPRPGQDRWCVTWRLYTESGAFLPHDECPMAIAIKDRRKIRGSVAVAERPDGTRVPFTPYPAPLFDEAGELIGAVNILVDFGDTREAEEMMAQARRCRRLAQSVSDERTVETLMLMAVEFEEKAQVLGRD